MNYFHWDIDPVLFHLGPLQVRWYGLLFVAGLFLGLEVLKWIYRREGRDTSRLDTLLVYMIVGIVVGARLAHTLIYEPDYFLAHPIEILYVWHGGLASHGGMVGAIVATWLYCRKYGESFLWLLSRLTIPGTIVAASVRIGNFFNSEILGLPTQVPWAVVFDRVDPLPRHPVQLYEAAAYLLLFGLLTLIYLRSNPETATRILPGTFLVTLFGIRFVLEYFKTEQADYVTGLPFTVGQLLSLPLILFGALWLLFALKGLRRS